MVFSSVIFLLVFLPVALIGHLIIYALAKRFSFSFWWANLYILIASSVFYLWGGPAHGLILLSSTLLNYFFGLLLCSQDGAFKDKPKYKKLTLAIGITLNLGLLGYFKYMNFFVDNGILSFLNFFLPSSLAVTQIAHIALPLGISFYTFQGMSYIIDIYRGEINASKSFVRFACYLTMFPQLVAGPIVRYITIEAELLKRRLSTDRFALGASRFIAGLAKKVLIADTLGRVADAAFSIPTEALSPLAAWAGIVCYTLQIYYDFSGYSDMAIGLGHMLGFTFPENFSYPYISQSIREFWRRWHISLSTWFRDYLYIPLGGSRRGVARTSLNLCIVFALCGLWHGASWIFLAWGLYHGLFLSLERFSPKFTGKLPVIFRHIYTIIVFMGGWVLFRSENFAQAWGYLKALGGAYEPSVKTNEVWMNLFAGDVYIALVIGIIGAIPVIPWLKEKLFYIQSKVPSGLSAALEAGRMAVVLALFLICLMPVFGATYTAFIYFRF